MTKLALKLIPLVALAASLAPLVARDAHACQPPLAGITARSAWPATGSVDVPINTGSPGSVLR